MPRPEGGSVEVLRKQAASCRSVAKGTKRVGAAEALIQIAEECDLKADAIEARAEPPLR